MNRIGQDTKYIALLRLIMM